MPEITEASKKSAAVRAQLRALMAAPAFRESERHRRLLEFLVESTLRGEAEGLKEFVIATEVWGRDVSFDPRIHSTVRVEVGRLRARLKKYYAAVGAPDAIQFRIPVGSYAVIFDGGPASGTKAGSIAEVKDEARFQMLELIGRGGMGEVWSAHDNRLHRNVALKFISLDFARNQAARDSFEKEARAAAALNHPNICTIYDVGEIDGQPFLAMELLEGQTLERRLAEQSVPIDSLVDWGIEVADALEVAHSRGIVHSDLKPGNLFLTTRGQTKILDFGLARLANDRNGREDRRTAGTPGYMSPEQMSGDDLDPRSDLFSLGIVLYRAATGRLPERLLGPPSSFNRQVPAELDRIIAKTLEPDREIRYQHAAELRADLKRLKRHSGSHGLQPPFAPSATTSTRARFGAVSLGTAAILLIAAALATYWYRSRVHKLTGNNDLVLAEFANSTGDAVFDSALREGLAAQLQQSPYLGVVSDARIAETLKLMMQPANTRPTANLALEICRRTASAAAIEGSIARLGSRYVLGLKALQCRTGNLLAQEQETADSKEQVLQALGVAVGKLRHGLGESLQSQQRFDTPLEDVSTGSLEALEAYSLGVQASGAGDCKSAITHFERAISLDANFAMAYGKLAICEGSGTSAEEDHRKAYALRDRVSYREQLYLSSHYEQYVTGDLEAARNLLQTWSQIYPHDGAIAPNLLKLYLTTGEYEKALPLVTEIQTDSPGTPAMNAARLATTLMDVNRLNEARAALDDAIAHRNDTPVLHFYLYEIDFVQHDDTAMAKEAAYLRQQSGWADPFLDVEAQTFAFSGQLARARKGIDQTIEDFKRAGDNDGVAAYLGEASVQEALAGRASVARADAMRGLALTKDKDFEINAGMALAVAGDPADAGRVADDLNTRFPANTMAQAAIAVIRSCALLGDGRSPDRARQAVEILKGASRYDAGGTMIFVPAYVRGGAYLAAGQSANAAAEFQKILDHFGVTRTFITGSLARYGLAEAEVQGGDKQRARADFAAFLALWKDADADLPPLKSARASLGKLSRGE